MSRAGQFAFLAVLLVSCDADHARDSQTARLGNLALEVPADWKANAGVPSVLSATWVPGGENYRKESVTILRSDVDQQFFRRGAKFLEQMLHSAQLGLPRAKLSKATPITTKEGFAGLQIGVEFAPIGVGATYHRVHVVLFDKTGVIHVLYTARDPDPDRAVLEMVLATLHHEEA